MVSSTEGSPTYTCWNRRSSAASFSTYLRYSSSVVAPIMRSSPRASIGLIMLPASIAPSAATGTDDGVDLVDEGDHLAGGVGDLLQHRLQPLFELAAVLRAGEHAADVERDEPLVLQALGHVAVGDATGQTLDDGRLADTRLADEDRVVLRAPAEHLDDPTDLVVAADDRIDLALAGPGGEVLAVLLERGELLFGVLPGDAMAAAHLLQGLQQLFAAHAETAVQGEQQMLDREVVVLQVLAVGVGVLEGVGELAVHPRLVAAVGLGQLGDRLVGLVAHHQRREAQVGQHGGGEGVVLAGERRHEVVGGELGVAEGAGLVDGGGHRLLGLDGPLLRIDRHGGMVHPDVQKT